MSVHIKTLKALLFGIKNNRILLGFIALIFVVGIPILGLLTGIDHHSQTESFMILSGDAAAYFGGLVIPAVLFSYVYRRKECDFYFAMPLKRRQFFWGYFFSGIVIFLVPFTLMYLICAAFFGVSSDGVDLAEYGCQLVLFFSLYCSMLLSVMFSGSISSTIVTFILRNSIVPTLIILPLLLAGVDGQAYFELLAPKVIPFIPMAGFYPISETVYYIAYKKYEVLAAMLLLALVDLTIAFFLHKYRKSESTMALAFPKSRYVYQYIVMLIFTMGMGAIFAAFINLAVNVSYIYDIGLLSSDNIGDSYTGGFGLLSPNNPNFKYFVFFSVLTAVIVFVMMNIILEKNVRSAFKKSRHLFFFLVGYGAALYAVCFLFAELPATPLAFEPDFAVITIYEKADVDSTVMSAEEWDELRHNEDYITTYSAYVEDDGMVRATGIWERKGDFIIVDINEIKYIAEGGEDKSVYCVRGHIFNESSYNNTDLDNARFFVLMAAKGDFELETIDGETICTAYNMWEIEYRTGYWFEDNYAFTGNYEVRTEP